MWININRVELQFMKMPLYYPGDIDVQYLTNEKVVTRLDHYSAMLIIFKFSNRQIFKSSNKINVRRLFVPLRPVDESY